MSRSDLTDITFVLDRSGSMQSIAAATVEAFNGFINSQRSGPGAAQLTLVQFDDQYDVLYEGQPIQQVPNLTNRTYQPRGATALLDAMGRTIVATGERLTKLPEKERPGTVVFVTLTDGYENSSREYTLQRVNEMIREQRDKYAWQFIFLGANQDAIATAAQLGMAAGQAMTFSASPQGTKGCLGAFDGKMHQMRAARAKGAPGAIVEFDKADRDAARDSLD